MKQYESKETRDLKPEVSNLTTSIENALYDLKKAELVLEHWMDAYLFYEKPDPVAALAFGTSSPATDNTHSLQSATWFMEYEKITQFIIIASDYILQSKELLEKAMEQRSLSAVC